MYVECLVLLSRRSGRSWAVLGCGGWTHVCIRRPLGETFKVLSWLKCYCIRGTISLPLLRLSHNACLMQMKAKKKICSLPKLHHLMWIYKILTCVWLFSNNIPLTATDTEQWGNIEGSSPSMLSVQPLSETLRSTVLAGSLSNTIRRFLQTSSRYI